MSVFQELSSSEADSDVLSTSSESSEDVLATIWKQYSVKYQPVYSLKLKNQFRSTRVLGKELPALTCSLSYTLGHQSNYSTAVVKPSNPNSGWIRKIKVFPDKQEVRVFARRWNLGGWAVLQAQGDWDWSSGRKLKTKWENEIHNLSSKFKIPRAPSLVQLRPHWNLKKHFPSVQGKLGGNSGEQHTVEQPYCHCKIPRMELVLTAGKPSNWRSIWPPTKLLFGSRNRAQQRKLAWEESLDADSRKDQFVRGLSPADREQYYSTHL